ncbi:hypothetical protein, partial [Thioalkalivibrio sp.]|uniref:hypothetical protein n=1 Tax=Thioalkalivibrio sp. TaxID=2093813 RepID=UPI0012D4F6F9
MQEQRLYKRFAILAIGLIALALSSAALAQMGQQRGAQQPGALEQEFLQLQERLQQAQQRAMENNPALQEQADAMEDLVTDKMREAGYDPGAIMETLLAAQGQVQDESLSDAQRREILESQEVREAQQQLQEAQQAVMQDPEVVEAQRSFEEDMMEAMRSEEPETDRIIERLQEIQLEAQRGM